MAFSLNNPGKVLWINRATGEHKHNVNVAGGVLGYAQVTADQSGITTNTDLTGLAVTVNVMAGRRIKITAQVYPYSTVDGDTAAAAIEEGATVLCATQYPKLPTNAAGTLNFSVVVMPTSGSHTYKLVGWLSVGSGNITFHATATRPAFILVEDIGAA